MLCRTWRLKRWLPQAGLGTLNAEGRFITPQFGALKGGYIPADVIGTDLPLAADG